LKQAHRQQGRFAIKMTLQWYFSVGILIFCAVAMVMRLGALAGRHTASKVPIQWLAARFSNRSSNWYCFFRIPDLTGENGSAPLRSD